MASSRVGLRITALTPAAGFLISDSSRGRTKASVLPVPVCAVATISWPASAGEIVLVWTAVGCTKLCRARLACKTGDKEISENVCIQKFGEGDQRVTNVRINFDLDSV